MDREQLLRLWALRKQEGDAAGAEQIATILAQQGTQEALAVDQGVAAQEPTQQYADVPSVPTAPTPTDVPTAPSQELSPAENLADQTTNNQGWLDKIVQALYGERYSGAEHMFGQAEITPGVTVPNLAGKDYVGQGEYTDLVRWEDELTSPQFLSNVGLILGPMVAQKIAPSVQIFKSLPPQAKAAALIPLITTLTTMTGGAISDLIRKGPLATTPIGKFDFSGDTVGERAYNTFFSDPNTLAGRAQQGFMWGTAPEIVLGGLGLAGRGIARKAMGFKPQAIEGIEQQLGAAERLSQIDPQNIRALTEWHRIKGQPGGTIKAMLPEKIPFTNRLMPEVVRGPPKPVYDPSGRVLAGTIPTEPYIAATTGFGKATGAIAPLPLAGKAIRQSAGYASGQAIRNVERMLDEVSPSMGPADASNLAYQGAKDFGVRRVTKHKRLYDLADEKAAALPGLSGHPEGYVVPTARIVQAADDVLAQVSGGPLKVSGEAMNVYPAMLSNAQRWVDEASQLGEYATVAQIRNLQNLVRTDLRTAAPTVQRNFALQYRDALKQSINVDMVAALEAAGIAEARSVANAYKAANRSVDITKQITQSTAGQQFTKVNQRFWDEKALKGGFVEPGSKEADELFTFAFNARDPQYLKTMRTIMGQDAYNAAARLYLSNAINRAMVQAKGGMAGVDRMVYGMQNPVKFNLDVFRRGLGYEGGVLPVGANDTLKQLLKGTGSKITTQTLDDLGTILSRYPINMDLATMAARRIPLAGTKGALSAITGGVAKAGGVAGGGAFGGAKGAAIAFALLVGLNNLGRVITNDAMLKALVRYARTADKTHSSKFASKYAKNVQRAGFVKLFTQWGYDAADAEQAFDNLEGTYREGKYYTDYPEEIIPSVMNIATP